MTWWLPQVLTSLIHMLRVHGVGNIFLLPTDSETGGTCTCISQTGYCTLNTRNTGNKNSLKISTSTVVFSHWTAFEFCITLLESMSTKRVYKGKLLAYISPCTSVYFEIDLLTSSWFKWNICSAQNTSKNFFLLFHSLTFSCPPDMQS